MLVSPFMALMFLVLLGFYWLVAAILIGALGAGTLGVTLCFWNGWLSICKKWCIGVLSCLVILVLLCVLTSIWVAISYSGYLFLFGICTMTFMYARQAGQAALPVPPGVPAYENDNHGEETSVDLEATQQIKQAEDQESHTDMEAAQEVEMIWVDDTDSQADSSVELLEAAPAAGKEAPTTPGEDRRIRPQLSEADLEAVPTRNAGTMEASVDHEDEFLALEDAARIAWIRPENIDVEAAPPKGQVTNATEEEEDHFRPD